MPPIISRPSSREITLPQVLAVFAIWAGVVYGLAQTKAPQAEQISLKHRPAVGACAPQG